jgi:RimJ/RimL family protein N-acetyltransferase
VIETERLILRDWTPSDRDDFAAMNADPEVMRWFAGTQSRAESDAAVERLTATMATRGFCFWPVILKADGRFLGIAGLKEGALDTPLEGMVEIGWRFVKAAWGHGYATEAARAAVAHGFADPACDRIGAMTASGNVPSMRVMERLGMVRRPDLDFEHPAVPVGSHARPHVIYLLDRPA